VNANPANKTHRQRYAADAYSIKKRAKIDFRMTPASLLLQGNSSDGDTLSIVNRHIAEGLGQCGYRVTVFPIASGAPLPALLSPPDIYLFHGSDHDTKNAPGRLNVFLLSDEILPARVNRLNTHFDLLIVATRRLEAIARKRRIRVPIVVVPLEQSCERLDDVLRRAWKSKDTPPVVQRSASSVIYSFSVKGRISWKRGTFEIDALLRRRYAHYRSVSYDASLTGDPSDLVVGQSEFCLEAFLLAQRQNPKVRRILHQEGTALERRIAITNRERKRCGAPLILKPPIEIWRNRMECDLADFIVVASRSSAKYFLDAGYSREKVRVIPWGIDLRERRKRRPSRKLRFLFAGTEPFRKGIRLLLEAWHELRPAGAELWCYTSEEIFQSQKLLRYLVANPTIIVKPLVPHRIFQALLQEIDCQILPSLEDSFSFVIGDGMGRGVPAIVSDETGIADLMVDRENGMIVRTGSIQQLMSAIDFCCTNPRRLHAIGDAVYETARLYSWDRFRNEFARLTDACLHGHGAASV